MIKIQEQTYLAEIVKNDQLIDFAKVKADEFQPTLESYRNTVAQLSKTIAAKGENATFQDVIVPLEELEVELTTLISLFQNLLGGGIQPELIEHAGPFFGTVSALNNDLMLDEDIFRGVEYVYKQIQNTQPSDSAKFRLIELWHRNYVREGAKLAAADKQKLREIDEKLSGLGPQFDQNVVMAMEEFKVDIEDESLLQDLTESQRAGARARAQEAGLENAWRFTLNISSFVPFMKHVPDSELRHKMVLGWDNLCYKHEKYDNSQLIARIVKLRQERAELLGFQSYAHYILQDRMLNSPQRVDEFLQDILKNMQPAAKQLHKTLAEFAPEYLHDGRLNGWDRAYLTEQYRKATIDLNENELRAYFELNATVKALFNLSKELFGVELQQVDIPLPHPSASAYSVKDSDGSSLGYLYLDLFERKGKQQGAWCSTLRTQHRLHGKDERPHVYITCNFQLPQGDTPNLLSFMEAETLFHEYGHGLHNLCSQCEFPSLSGTSVSLDFVELPSQLMENFLLHTDSLKRIAQHHETGAPIPDDLIQKIKRNRVLDAGHVRLFESLCSVVDQRWHSPEALHVTDPVEFERSITADYSIWRYTPNSNFSCTLSHIFSSGYAAGFYSYMWSRVLDADAFNVFRKNGVMAPETARRFRDDILARGNEKAALDLFRSFCGHDPEITPLLLREGLVTAAE